MERWRVNLSILKEVGVGGCDLLPYSKRREFVQRERELIPPRAKKRNLFDEGRVLGVRGKC